MVVAGEWGLNIFNPSHVFKDTVAAPIYITSISISGNVTHYFPDSRQRIVLGSNHKTLDIAFVALDFSAAENIKYRYQLEGFEDSLTTVNGGNLSVKYSNLPWGKYTFKVFCTNADGVWGTTPAQLFFKVRLPFYLRWWFIIFCLSVFGALFYFIVKTREAYLKAENLRLDSIIQERTEEVLTQNEELRVQRDIIGQQSDEIKQVNIHLTDSIEYALTLQNALMPSKIEFEAVLGASMLIFKPKDIVSGDLYWLKGSYEKFTLVVGDCTGHGVHGGFMSMMGLTFISESYAANPNANPLELLITVHQHFAETLKLATNNPTLTSGMDIAICEVDRKLGVMSYSGARLPLYLLKQNGNNCTLDKYKSGKKPVGSPWFTPDVPLIEIPINPGDTLVLATDGAFDQLSLVERKRFNRVQFEEVLLRNQPQPIDKLSTAIERELSAWQDKGIQTDDITVLGFVV
jgi:serine phosphatase RsbU (regulator of sigma subunit)